MIRLTSLTVLATGAVIDLQPASGVYTTVLEYNQLRGRVAGLAAASVPRASRGAAYGGTTRPTRTITVRHHLDEDILEAAIARLAGDVYDDHGECLLTYLEDGVSKTTRVVPTDLVEASETSAVSCAGGGIYRGTWLLLDEISHAASPTTTGPTTMTTTPHTEPVDVAGTVPTDAVVYQLAPTAQKAAADGQRFRQRRTIVNRAPRPMAHWPVLVATLDHAAEVTAGRSLASGDDVTALVAGRRAPRWTPNASGGRSWDEAATDVWCNLTLPAGRSWTLRGAVSLGATTAALREAFVRMPAAPFHALADDGSGGLEVWLVTAVDEATRKWTIVRGRRGTDDMNVPDGATVWWAPEAGHVDLLWGWTDAPSPTYIDDREKPIFLEAGSGSDNDGFTFEHFYACENAADTQSRHPRAAGWITRALGKYDRERKTGDGDQFWRWVPSNNGTPGTALGLEYQSAGAVGGRPLMDRWDWYSPVGISEYEFDWVADTIKYEDGGAGDLEAALNAYHVDGDGTEVLAGRFDDSLALGGGSGTETITPAIPALAISFRIEPFDPKTWEAATLIAFEPADGDGWSVARVEVTFDPDQTVLVAGDAAERQDIYQIGRSDAPAILGTTRGSVEILGVVLGLADTLTLGADAQSALVTIDGEAEVGAAHLLRGALPGLPADTGSGPYPVAGSASVTFVEDGLEDLDLTVTHRDAWN